MPVSKFLEEPFRNTNPRYDESCLSIGVQPEYATGDVLLGACYRTLKLLATHESEVDLEAVIQLPERLNSRLSHVEVWEFLLGEALRSPVRPRESSSKPLPQLVPLVPSLGQYSGVLGRRRNRWNPGRLTLYALACGHGPQKLAAHVERLARAIDVDENEDDQFALFLEKSISPLVGDVRRPIDEDWRMPSIRWPQAAYRESPAHPLSPAEAFAQDLSEILELKQALTRRQWCALVESLLRLGLSMHVLWICRLNEIVWRLVLDILAGSAPLSHDQVEQRIWSGHIGNGAFLDGGQSSDSYLRRQVESYSTARLGINLILHCLDDAATAWELPERDAAPLSAAAQIVGLLNHISHVLDSLPDNPREWVSSQLGMILDDQASKVSGRSGAPKNLYEFLAHTLRRRPSKEPSLNEHDQSYLLAKLPGPSNAPWVVRPGPVLLLAMCYATCKSMQGAPVTLQDLARRFAYYGVRLSTGDLQEGQIADDLGALGALVDSPDAGGGRLVLNPFEYRMPQK